MTNVASTNPTEISAVMKLAAWRVARDLSEIGPHAIAGTGARQAFTFAQRLGKIPASWDEETIYPVFRDAWVSECHVRKIVAAGEDERFEFLRRDGTRRDLELIRNAAAWTWPAITEHERARLEMPSPTPTTPAVSGTQWPGEDERPIAPAKQAEPKKPTSTKPQGSLF